jgi:hypothetical protein
VFRRPLSVAAVVALALSLAAPSLATTVHLRVEGLTQTLFDGDVSTSPHAVMGHVCDGTNGGANPAPGATMTGALDDARVSWAGTWFDSFQDFSIDRIGGDAADVASGRFWGLLLNGKQTDVGGCQERVADGDEVLFAYDLFQKAHVLRLSTSTASVETGQPVALAVVDSQTGSPAEGASLATTTTGPDGRATTAFPAPGSFTVRAEKSDSIRSNAVTICVYDATVGGCGVPPASPANPPSPPPPSPVSPPPPPSGPSVSAAPPAPLPSCARIEVLSRPLTAGNRRALRLRVSRDGVRVGGIGLRIRGSGIDVRRVTDPKGLATGSLRPRNRGRLRVGVVGETRRCGTASVAVRKA